MILNIVFIPFSWSAFWSFVDIRIKERLFFTHYFNSETECNIFFNWWMGFFFFYFLLIVSRLVLVSCWSCLPIIVYYYYYYYYYYYCTLPQWANTTFFTKGKKRFQKKKKTPSCWNRYIMKIQGETKFKKSACPSGKLLFHLTSPELWGASPKFLNKNF